MFTVTHYGTEKQFDSIFAAMRYAIKHWQANATIWTPDQPLWSACQWVEKKQTIQAKTPAMRSWGK
jgi:hypothetical protein